MNWLRFIGFILSLFGKLVAIPIGYMALLLMLVTGLRTHFLFRQIKYTLDNIWNLKWLLIERERTKHIQLIGATGSGKTTALQCLIDRSIRSQTGFLLIDSRGSLPERVIANKRFSLKNIKRHYRNLVYLDFENNPPAFNVLNVPMSGNILEQLNQAETLAEELTEALSTNMRPEPNEAQKNLLKNLLVVGIHGHNTTLLSILHWLGVNSTEHQAEMYNILQEIPSLPLKRYFNEDFKSGLLVKTKEALRNRLSSLITPHQLYRSLCAKKCTLDFSRILRQNQFVVVKASSAVLGNYPARTISNLVLSLLYSHGFKRLISHEKTSPFHVYIDELEYFANQSLIQSLKSARQTGISYCLSYQELNQSGISPGLQKTINREAAVKIIGQLRADEQKNAIGLIGIQDKQGFERLKTGQFWVKAGRVLPFQMSFPSKFAVHKSRFGSWWTGRAFMSKRQVSNLLEHINPKKSELNYQWPHSNHVQPSPSTSNFSASKFSPHGIPLK